MKMKLRKGFTLIELLVVIAIIGILAAMILVALNTARNKAKDSRIKGDVAQMRTMAETLGGDYSTLSTAVPLGINSYVLDVTNQGGSSLVINGTTNAYAISAQLTTAGQYICADSTGITRSETVTLAAATYACTITATNAL